LVLDKATNDPVPFAVIQVNNTRRRAICNQNGFFSIPVVATDTLNFFSLSYFRNSLSVGKLFETGYEPIKGAKGETIGIYYVGYSVE